MQKITKRTLQQYRDDGVIPFIALPGKMLYRESDLRAALEKNHSFRSRDFAFLTLFFETFGNIFGLLPNVLYIWVKLI